MIRALIFSLAACFSIPAVAEKFEKYPAEVYVGKPAKPDFASFPEARQYKTRIRGAFSGGVNFAGKYAITTWGCGMGCAVAISLNIQTGEISPFQVPVSGEEFYGVSFDYKPNSRLLKVNWEEFLNESKLCVSREYVLDSSQKLTKISERKTRPRDDGCATPGRR